MGQAKQELLSLKSRDSLGLRVMNCDYFCNPSKYTERPTAESYLGLPGARLMHKNLEGWPVSYNTQPNFKCSILELCAQGTE